MTIRAAHEDLVKQGLYAGTFEEWCAECNAPDPALDAALMACVAATAQHAAARRRYR